MIYNHALPTDPTEIKIKTAIMGQNPTALYSLKEQSQKTVPKELTSMRTDV